MREDEGYGAGSIFLSFLLGGLVGAGFALLLAPQSGRETRQKIKEFYRRRDGKGEGLCRRRQGKNNGRHRKRQRIL